MSTTKHLVAALSAAAVVDITALSPASAASATVKPLSGLSFDIGSKHAVSYFQRDNGSCKLVLTYAEAPDWDGVPSLTATRFETSIGEGKTVRHNVSEGEALEFVCLEGAEAMSVRQLDRIAAH
jgi:hypothetical protein